MKNRRAIGVAAGLFALTAALTAQPPGGFPGGGPMRKGPDGPGGPGTAGATPDLDPLTGLADRSKPLRSKVLAVPPYAHNT